jgi:hypothetical protein
MSIQELEQRHLYQPTEEDVTSGNSLNAVLMQLHNPNVPNSLLDQAGSDLKLTGDMIKLIPLQFAQRGIIISLDRLSVNDGWPLAITGPEFQAPRSQYEAIVKEAKELEGDAKLPDQRIIDAINAVAQMQKIAKSDLDSKAITGPQYAEAERFLKSLAAMLQAARQPDIRKILRQAAEKPEIPLANAVAFMEVFNLQFGAAKSPEEKALYLQTLQPMLSELRNRVEGQLKQKIDTPTTQVAQLNATQGRSAVANMFQEQPFDAATRTAPPVEPPPVNEPAGRQ